ncbi:hypothetical protein HKD37_19G053596 [Glycine soja]
MTSEAAKEIANKIDAFEEQASQGSFVAHGRHDVLTTAIGRPEHPGRVRVAGASVTIKQYFGLASRTSYTSSSMAPKDLHQLKQQIRDQLEDSFTEKFQSQMQSQGLALPPKPEVGRSATRVSTKESCVDPSGNDPDTGDSDKCGLYIEEYSPHLVALGRVYEGSTTIHNIPLLHDQVKVGVQEVRDADAPIPVPTKELFLKSLQVIWDATLFGLFNEDFPLYIKHEDLSEIAHGGQCLSISVIQLWILNMTETSMRAGNTDVYGFLEPQFIQRSDQSQFESKSYIKNWMQNSKRDVYLGAYLNGPYNYLKGIINSALKGLDDTQQSKSKPPARWIVVKCNRQKGSTECGYYVMHWMSSIILGNFKNNWEMYFTDVKSLEPERLKALRI